MNAGRIAAAFALLAAACKAAPPPAEKTSAAGGGPSALPSIRATATPPSAKDVIDAALQSANVPLDVNETCRGVGTEATDATLGRYLSGFMAGLDPEAGQNGIVTSVEEVPTGWVCRFLVQRRAGEEVWRWGLEFEFGKDGMLKASSYRCIGAG